LKVRPSELSREGRKDAASHDESGRAKKRVLGFPTDQKKEKRKRD